MSGILTVFSFIYPWSLPQSVQEPTRQEPVKQESQVEQAPDDHNIIYKNFFKIIKPKTGLLHLEGRKQDAGGVL